MNIQLGVMFAELVIIMFMYFKYLFISSNFNYFTVTTEACQVEMSIVQRLTVDSNEAVADCLSRALSVNAATSSANIAAAKDILYGEALPLSNPVTLTLLPKPDM